MGNGRNFLYYSYFQIPYEETTPVHVLCGDMNTTSGYLEDICDIDAGELGSIALDTSGCVYVWGIVMLPLKVPCGDMNTDSNYLENIVDVACDYRVQYAVDDVNGNVWKSTFPDDLTPYLVTDGEQTPEESDYLENIVAISAGYESVVTLDSSGNVWA